MMRVGYKGIELTEASLPVAETAATERLDCRKAFLNIVYEVQRELRLFSLKERCNWGRGWLEVEVADGRRRALSIGEEVARVKLNPVLPKCPSGSESALSATDASLAQGMIVFVLQVQNHWKLFLIWIIPILP
jgi:hypothetical protein